MIDLKLLRENPEPYKQSVSAKNVKVDIDRILELDKARRALITEIEAKKADQNKVSKEIPKLEGEEKQKELARMKELVEVIKKEEEELGKITPELDLLVCQIPNLLDKSTPVGKDESENVVLRTVGTKPEFSFTPKEHWELGEMRGMLDLERGAKVSGSRFYYLKGDLVLLHRAIQNLALSIMTAKGFTPVIPPFLVRERAMYGTGFFPAEKNEIYHVNPEDDDLYLIGTSEVPLVNYYDGEILDEAELPIRFAGISPCFRREAGSYGKDTKGILRVHQFEKVEMVTFVKPEEALNEHEFILSVEEEICQALEIPYQVVNICSGDLGIPAAKKYDIEAWMPGQGKYREVTSTSNCTDFQTRRLNIRYRTKEGKVEMLYALNGTGTSMRPLIAVMENFQEADGSIRVPKALVPFLGKEKI